MYKIIFPQRKIDCEEKFDAAERSFSCRGRQPRSATSAFLKKGFGTSFVDAVCELLHATKRFFGEVYPSIIRRKFRAKFSKIYVQFLLHIHCC